MIAKHVVTRSARKSHFANLVNYITDAQSKENRVGQVRLTNCCADSIRDAISEALATQQTNTRAKSNKTFHLIVSFRAGDNLAPDILAAIEDRLCHSLGFGEHQRISAVHNDTDNQHIHIAINKIHPTHYTIHEPYYSHRTLAEQCEKLEHEFGLQKDNHIANQNGSASIAKGMERHSDMESLISWIKRECLDNIKNAQSWSELHSVLNNHGLAIAPRGNGLVISAQNGITIKASTLGRDFSKQKLETRLGQFTPSENNHDSSKTETNRHYQRQPTQTRFDTSALYAQYQREQKDNQSIKEATLASLRQKKNQQILQAKRQGKARRSMIKIMGNQKLTKRVLYAQASQSLQKDLAEIHKRYQSERQEIFNSYGKKTWIDWLKVQATQGNKEALTALRSRKNAPTQKGNSLRGSGKTQADHPGIIDSITKKGTILFRSPNGAVHDDGSSLSVTIQSDSQAIVEALKIAVTRYGDKISVSGSPEFKARVIRASVEAKLTLTFSDEILEKRRQQLLAIHNTNQRKSVSPIGKAPPSIRRNWLSSLSQLDVLHMDRPHEKPPSHLEQRKAQLQAELQQKKEKQARKGRSR